MANAALKQEVDELREIMTALGAQALRTEISVQRLSNEMIELKNEMRAFKDEMRDFKNEMRDFKDEMVVFKDESMRERQCINKQWGDLANRLGTLVEDIVAPSLPRVAADLFGCERPELFALRVQRRFNGDTREYDALVVCPDCVLVNETKSRLHSKHVERLLAKLAELPSVFPEYAEKRIIGVLASLYPDPSIVNRATSAGILVMGMGDEAMQVLNPEALSARDD